VPLLCVAFAQRLCEAPPLLRVAALLPAALAVAGAAWLTRRGRVARWLGGAAFLWGAAVTPAVAATLSPALRGWLTAGDVRLATSLTAAVAAPIIEETIQAAGLVLLIWCWRDAVRDARDGLLYGAAMGVGFALAENLNYFALAALAGGAAGLTESVYLRAVLGSPIHAVFTAASGAGIGAACAVTGACRRAALVMAGLAAAVVQHAAWNGIGALWLDTAACAPRAAAHCGLAAQLVYWSITAPLLVALFVSPGVLGLLWVARATAPAYANRGGTSCRSNASTI